MTWKPGSADLARRLPRFQDRTIDESSPHYRAVKSRNGCRAVVEIAEHGEVKAMVVECPALNLDRESKWPRKQPGEGDTKNVWMIICEMLYETSSRLEFHGGG